MATEQRGSKEQLQEFFDTLDQRHLFPGWTWMGMTPEPQSRIVPYLWKWSDVEPMVRKGAEIVPVGREGAERRILRFSNPGFKHGSTQNISVAIQTLHPGEAAPAHRHTPLALRFMLRGEWAYTTVEGDRCEMHRGDLVLTPPWTWHNHGNEGDGPVIWLDGLDTPLMRWLEPIFYEDFPEDEQPVTKPGGESVSRYGGSSLKPAWETWDKPFSPLIHYRWEQTLEALSQLAKVASSPFDDVAMEYTNPLTGGHIVKTLACWMQLIRPDVRTKAHRHTSSTFYHVLEGQGFTVINGQQFDWNEGDTFVVPTWAWHEHANTSKKNAFLYSIHDIPVMEAVGHYREEPYVLNGGNQAITSRFEGTS